MHRHIDVIEQKGRASRNQRSLLGRSSHDPPQGGYDDPINSFRIVAIVCSHPADHIGSVVEPLEHEVVIKVDLLYLGMCRKGVWISYLQNTPGFAIFDVLFQFLGRKS